MCLEAFDIADRVLYGEWDGKPGDKLTQGLNVLMIVVSLALFANGRKRLRSVRTGAALMFGLALFLISSALWSGNPAGTVRQGIVYMTVVIGVIGIASNLEIDEFMTLVAGICGLAALLSLLLVFVSPGMVYSDRGDYRAIFSSKNMAGEAMAVGALAALHVLRASSQHKWRNRLILILVTIVCFLSKSATSLSTIFVLCSVDGVIAMIRKGGIIRILGIAGAFVAVQLLAVVLIFPDSVMALMGKDPTLTGRTEIWGFVISDILQKPLLGWGYNGFWFIDNPAALEIDSTVLWVVPESHNGLLEILLDLGVVGAALFLFALARNITLGLRCLRASDTALGITSLLCCATIILTGISEMVLLAGLEASTPIFFVTGLYCERALWLRQRRSAAPERIAHLYQAPRRLATSRALREGHRRIG